MAISQILFDQKFAWLVFQSAELHRQHSWSEMEASYTASLCLQTSCPSEDNSMETHNMKYISFYTVSYERRIN